MNTLLKAMAKEISKDRVSLTVSRATAKEGSIKPMNNDKTVSRSGDQKPLSSTNHKNMPPSSGQSSNPVADGNSRISDGRLVGSKVWRNMSYMMATDESLLNEINEGRDANEMKTGSTFPAQVNGQLSRYVSGINLILKIDTCINFSFSFGKINLLHIKYNKVVICITSEPYLTLLAQSGLVKK